MWDEHRDVHCREEKSKKSIGSAPYGARSGFQTHGMAPARFRGLAMGVMFDLVYFATDNGLFAAVAFSRP